MGIKISVDTAVTLSENILKDYIMYFLQTVV